MMRLAFLTTLVSCVPASAPQRQHAEPPLAGETGARAPVAPASPPPPIDPYATAPCPADLSLAVARTLDGRMPANTQPGPYTKEHGKPVTAKQLVAATDAIAKIIELETRIPGVVPGGFRAAHAEHARDARYRLFMARCELGSPITTRRAGYDAGLALLLGASPADVLPLVSKSFYPDGPTSMSCTRAADCAPSACDPVTRSCMSRELRTAELLSAPELAIEDTLVRAFAAMLTREMIEDTRYHADDLIGTWAYGRYVRCTSGSLCNFTRYEVEGHTMLVNWDRRYRGESHELELTGAAKQCAAATSAADLDTCIYTCKTGAVSREAACITRCQAFCR